MKRQLALANETKPIKNSHQRARVLRRWQTCAISGACLAIYSLASAVSPPPDGGYPGGNTAEGEDALFSLTTGLDNTAVGFNALYRNTAGNGNTASGWSTLFNNTTGYTNTASGVYALLSNGTGFMNTATGGFALLSNTTGFENTAGGSGALSANTTGNLNTANGFQALHNNKTSNYNTAIGANSLVNNSVGANNTAVGANGLTGNTTGNNNTAVGFIALDSNTTGSSNIAIGVSAGANLTTGSGNIDIGNPGVAGESHVIRIGRTATATYISGISGATVPGGVGVIVDSSGHLGTVTSSSRFKENIQPMDKTSEAILSLQPVTFRYKENLDPKGILQFGLVAEEVEKINPALVARDDKGKPYSVRYEAVNAMLLNEFLKEHRKVEEQTCINQQQEATIARLEAALNEQAGQIQKVSAQLAAVQTGARLVTNE